MSNDTPEYALAEAWASIDGKLDDFIKGRDAESFEEETENHGGYYSGYMVEAGEMIKRLKERGFIITRVE